MGEAIKEHQLEAPSPCFQTLIAHPVRNPG